MSFLLLIDAAASFSELSAASDALSMDERLLLLAQISRRQLRELYALASLKSPTHENPLELLVPAKDEAVDWHGRNNLPLFRRFVKRFTRTTDSQTLVGHNQNAPWVNALIGPGYFCAT